MIHFVRKEGKNWRNVMLLLVCTEGENFEECDETV